jgi:hypothetical protein
MTSSGVTHDAGRWLAAGRERHGEVEAEALGQGRADRAMLRHRRFIGARTLECGGQAGSGAACGTWWSQSPDKRALMWDRGGRQVGPSGRKFSA